MDNTKFKISGTQLTFSTASIIFGSILLVSFVTPLVKHDATLVSIMSLLIAIPLALIYTSLTKMCPGMNLIQINNIVYGSFLGKVVSVLYIFYFFMVLTFNIRESGDFFVTFIMPDTPLEVFLIVTTLVCAYTIWKGIEVLARTCYMSVIIGLFAILTSTLLLIPNMDFSNFLPFFEMPFNNYIQAIHIISVIPYGEIFLILTFADTFESTKHTTKNVLAGLFIGAISFIFTTIRNTAVLGISETILMSPSYYTYRIIDVSNVLTRMDILISIGITINKFFKICLFYYATVSSLSQLLRLKSYIPLILPIGGIAIIISVTNWQSFAEYAYVSPTIAPIFITPFIIIFPILTLLIAKMRNFVEYKRRE